VQRIFINECFLFTVGSVSGVRFITVSRNPLKDEEVETEVRKWLRQRSKDFYAASFDVLVKRWDNVDGGYFEK
jgi:hypothetical protein